MRVEIWSDIICPWCGIGKARLDKAVADFPEAEVVFRSFELDPNAGSEPQPVRDMLRKKYRMSDEQLAATSERIQGLAAAEGLVPYRVGDNRVANTSLAHELAAFAADNGRAAAMWDRLYRAYFGEASSVFDVDALVLLAAEVGLDADAAREALVSRRYAARVKADGNEARQLGATGVPFVVIDRKFGVSGAQSVEVFRQALQRARG